MQSIHTDALSKTLSDRTDDASIVDKDTLWLLFNKVDGLAALRQEAHKKYAATIKTLEREHYVKMSRLERDLARLQTAIKTIAGSSDVRKLRLAYDTEHAPPDVTAASTPPP